MTVHVAAELKLASGTTIAAPRDRAYVALTVPLDIAEAVHALDGHERERLERELSADVELARASIRPTAPAP